jgi:hypothetical protein
MIEENAVAQFLQVCFDTAISDITQIGAGIFLQAFLFKLVQQEYVLRLNQYKEDFQKDVFVYQCFSSKIPVLKVVVCDCFDQKYYFVTLGD